jgi:penicillin-binding protein 1A
MTAAYVPFAKNGMSATLHSVLEITSESGEQLYAYEPPVQERLIEEDMAEAMTHLMYQVIYRGTGKRANLGDRPAAGKTGTSQDWRDAWFIGYTANYVTGIWVGNDDNTPTDHVVGGGLPAMIWKDFMTLAHDGYQVAAMPGAVPARDVHNVQEFKEFLSALSSQLRRVDANDRLWSRSRRDKPPKKKRKFFPWD